MQLRQVTSPLGVSSVESMGRYRPAIRLCSLVLAILWPGVGAAQTVIEPDRPDLTNGAHLLPVGSVQFELGASRTRDSGREHTNAAPVNVRIGVADWLEAEVGVDALVTAGSIDAEATESGAFQVGAKIRLWSDSNGQSRLSLLTAVDVPTAIDEAGTKSRDPDVSVTALWGFDVGSRAHLDVNYGIGSAHATVSEPRFVQHAASGSLIVSLTPRVTPYFEVFGISREHADGAPVVVVDTGVTFIIRPRVALDAGILFGTTDEAPSVSVFGGVSFMVGGKQ